MDTYTNPIDSQAGGAHSHKHTHQSSQGWIAWAMQNRIVMIIILVLFVIIVVPWLICDVLGLSFICDIINGIVYLIKKIFGLIGSI